MIPIKLTSDLQKEEVVNHLLSLRREDLRLRFGYSPTDSIIRKYVEDSWRKSRNQWFGVCSTEGCIATVHVAISDDKTAELGCTVSQDYRQQGIGNDLFLRAVTWARSYGVKRIFMHCLTENKAIQKIANKNNMDVVIMSGGEAEAIVDISADPMAPYSDVMLDRIAIYDMMLLNQRKLFETIFRIKQ